MPKRNPAGRVHACCLPCGAWSKTNDLESANEWIERHWLRCKRTALYEANDERKAA